MNTNNIIDNEDEDLKGMAPHLYKMKNNNPFKANEDYFETFNSSLQNKVDSFEEIKEEAPVLASIPKYNPFEVPVDYFEELPTIVQQRAINAKPKTILLEWLLLLIKPRFAFPVLTTLLIAVAGINYMNKNADMPKTEVAEEITTEDQLYNIDEATIIESVNVNQSNENTTVSGEENNIQNYLLENNVDETNLKNEL